MIGVHSDAITGARDLDLDNRYEVWVGVWQVMGR
jgi:hypothetical protein